MDLLVSCDFIRRIRNSDVQLFKIFDLYLRTSLINLEYIAQNWAKTNLFWVTILSLSLSLSL